MNHELTRDDTLINYYLNSDFAYTENRIDCISVNRYYQINDDKILMFRIEKPTIYGIEKLKERKILDMKNNPLKEKLQAKKSSPIESNNPLKNKLALKNSAINKASLTSEKFAEVNELRDEVKNLQVDTVNLQSDIEALSKVIMENNSFIASIATDLKANLKLSQSALNAINSMHGKFASPGKASKPDIKSPDTVINRKGHALNKPLQASIIEGLADNEIQGLYEHFKTYFNHKFAKSSKPDKLAEFKGFINGIDFASIDTIDKSARVQWQAYKNDNDNMMLYAPNSMKLAIESLIKLGNDFDLIASPDMQNSQVNTVVKDFAYWQALYSLPNIEIIAQCIDLIKSEGMNNNTFNLIIEYIKEESQQALNDTDFAEFNEYLNNTDFA